MLLKAMALSLFYLCLGLLLFSSHQLAFGEEGEEQSDAVYARPSFVSQAGEHTVLEGSSATLPCRVKDLGDYVVSWFKVAPSSDNTNSYNGDEPGPQLFVAKNTMTQDTRFEITDHDNEDNHDMHIVHVAGADSGPYECHISSTPALIQRQILKVNVPPSVNLDPDSSPYIVEPGHSVALKCYGGGYPAPNVTWSRVGRPLPDGRASHKEAQLFYDSATVNHSGVYRCTADNNIGDPASAEITIEVYSKDQIKNAPSMQTARKFIPVKVGDTIALSCNYSAYPPPSVHWIFNGYAINSQNNKWRDHASISFGEASAERDTRITTLTIEKVQDTDFGEYYCRAANSLGTVEEIIHVSGKPGPPYLFTAAAYEDRIDLSWHLESATDIKGYKLFYRKPQDDVSLRINVPAENGKRTRDNEWLANYSWPLASAMLEPGSIYHLTVQGENEYGDGSLPSSPLEIRTPGKFHGDGKNMGHNMKDVDVPGETSKSTKSDDPNGAAQRQPGRMAILSILIPMISLWVLRIAH